MSAQAPSTLSVSAVGKSLRQFWPWFLPLWVLPVPCFLLCLRLGFPILGALGVPLAGFLAGVPLDRGRITLGVAYVLICGATLLAWGFIYCCTLLIWGT
jgi:hypothetical protein